ARPAVERVADAGRVAADLSTALVEDRAALLQLGRRAERVPGIGILRHDPQHVATVRAEGEGRAGTLHRSGPKRRLAQVIVASGVAGKILPQQQVDQLDRLAEAPDQLGRLRKVDPERPMLRYVPPRADAELQAATADVIDRRRLFREQRGMAEGVAADQHADANSRGHRRQRAEQRPALEVRPVRMTWLDEVVAQPDAVEAEPIEQLPVLDHRGVRKVLIGTEADA